MQATSPAIWRLSLLAIPAGSQSGWPVPHISWPMAYRMRSEAFQSRQGPFWPKLLIDVITRAGFTSLKRRVVQAQGRHRAGTEVLHHDIGGGQQFEKNRAAALGFQVQGDAAFVGVEMQEQAAAFRMRQATRKRGDPACRIAPSRRFYLDDVGAVVGQEFGAEGARDVARQIQYPYPFQRLGSHVYRAAAVPGATSATRLRRAARVLIALPAACRPECPSG